MSERCWRLRDLRGPCSAALAAPSARWSGASLLGLLEAFSAGYISSNYKDAVAFLVILAVLFIMPQGLLGRAQVERV